MRVKKKKKKSLKKKFLIMIKTFSTQKLNDTKSIVSIFAIPN